MIFQETNSAFVMYKFLGTSYCNPKQYDKVIFLEMNLAKNLQSWSILSGCQAHEVKGKVGGNVFVQKRHPSDCSPAVRAHSVAEADASKYPNAA